MLSTTSVSTLSLHHICILIVVMLCFILSLTIGSSCPCRRPQGHHQESLHVEPWVLLIGTSWPLVGPQKGTPVGPPRGRPCGPSTPRYATVGFSWVLPTHAHTKKGEKGGGVRKQLWGVINEQSNQSWVLFHHDVQDYAIMRWRVWEATKLITKPSC